MPYTLNVRGPANTAYAGHVYVVEISHAIKFITPIFHPNIPTNGAVSTLLLEVSLPNLREQLECLLEYPMREYPYNDEAMQLWESNKTEFHKQVSSFYFANIQGNVTHS